MDEQHDLANRIAAAAQRQEVHLAVAESLTGGLVASRLAAAPDASTWFRGAVVAYAREVKHELLQVPAGPVVSEAAAAAMATSVAALLGAQVSLAVTGVGGPGTQDDQAPGTVWLAVYRGDRPHTHLHRFEDDGDPAAICQQACAAALRLLADTLGA
ncbi:MAG TPA: CinA family protein [Jatrophihabitantaceae bacterium]|nr:CinA family protein [Jatrophihabitantaceae bacterium]